MKDSSSKIRAVNTFGARLIPEHIRDQARCDGPELINEANRRSGPANDLVRRQTQLPQLADAAIRGALAQFLAARFPNQRVMCKVRTSRASEHQPETKLASCR